MKITHYNWIEKNGEFLLTNDMGQYVFLSPDEFTTFTGNNTDPKSTMYSLLKDHGFVYSDEDSYIDESVDALSRMKQCLKIGTQLLILVLTDACNQRCAYCQAGEVHASKTSLETCKKAIDIAVQSPVSQMTVEFQGGEPTLNPEALYFTIPYAKRVFSEHGKRVNFAIVTNLTDCRTELLRWLISEDVNISTSLDGHKMLHDINRPLASGRSSYEAWKQGADIFKRICKDLGKTPTISAIQTTTRYSLKFPKEIVDEYLRNDMNRLYIRPLTPLGYANLRWRDIGYTAREYLDFYLAVIDYMVTLCKQGKFVVETTASLYLTRILYGQSVGHTEFRSPCGAGVGQIAVNYDGKVYTCDEGRMIANMGDPIFCMGDVDMTYKGLMQSPVVHAVCTASCIECLPFCCDCVYLPYCAVCPVVNYGIEGDLISSNERNYRCEIAKGILDYLFELIQKNDPQEMDILRQWATEW